MIFNSKILSITIKNENLRVFEFSKPKDFIFCAGQYIWLEIDGFGRSPMAIASAVDEGNIIIAVRKWGTLTEELFNFNLGDEITIDGPHGTYISYNTDKVYLFAAGSGITPIRSLIMSNSNTDITLFYGGKKEDELLFIDEISKKDLELHTMISQPDNDWNGEEGRITELIEKYTFDITNAICFVCGPKQMMSDVTQILKNKGFDDTKIFVSIEKFDDDGNVIGPVFSLNHKKVSFLSNH